MEMIKTYRLKKVSYTEYMSSMRVLILDIQTVKQSNSYVTIGLI